jgi:hypothetical protein
MRLVVVIRVNAYFGDAARLLCVVELVGLLGYAQSDIETFQFYKSKLGNPMVILYPYRLK